MFQSTTTTMTTSSTRLLRACWCVCTLAAHAHLHAPACVCNGDYGVKWVARVGVVHWAVHSRLCLGRCGMIRGLTGVPQPMWASQSSIHSASQPASQPASTADRQTDRQALREAEHSCLSRPPLSSTIYWFTLWDFSSLAWDQPWAHTSAHNPVHTHRHGDGHMHTFTHVYTDATKMEDTHLKHCWLTLIAGGGGGWRNFFFFSFSFLWSYLLTLVKDPPSLFWVLMLCCCVFSNYRAWQWARTHKEYLWPYNYFGCLQNESASVSRINKWFVFNIPTITGVVVSVCVIFGYFLPFKSKDVAWNLFLSCPLILVILLFW